MLFRSNYEKLAMNYFVVWESAGCDGECGTVMVSDSKCGVVLEGNS